MQSRTMSGGLRAPHTDCIQFAWVSDYLFCSGGSRVGESGVGDGITSFSSAKLAQRMVKVIMIYLL